MTAPALSCRRPCSTRWTRPRSDGACSVARRFTTTRRPNVAFPYLTFGRTSIYDWSTGTESGSEHLFTLHIWSKAKGKKETLEIMEAAKARLEDARLALDEHHLVNMRLEFAEASIRRRPVGPSRPAALSCGDRSSGLNPALGAATIHPCKFKSGGQTWSHRRARTFFSSSIPAAVALSSPSPGCARSASPSTARPSTSPMPISPVAGANCWPAAACSGPPISGSGIFKDAQSDATIRSRFFAGEYRQLATRGAGFRHWCRPVPDHLARIYRRA